MRVIEIDIAGVAVSVVFSNSIDGSPMSEVGVLVQSGHDGGVVETVSLDLNGERIHGGSHILSVTDLISGAIHGWEVNVVDLASGVIVATDL